jgi:hypothetical protein
MSRAAWRTIARVIGALTVLAGAVQAFAPGFIAALIGAGSEPGTLQFAATVGMFMVLFGGMLLQATNEGPEARALVGWCAVQKLGASLAVTIGVVHGALGWFALMVAFQDFVSCFLLIGYFGKLGSGGGSEHARGY